MGLSLGDDEADQSDGYVPRDDDQRKSVERLIKERRGQQPFRDALGERFDDCCPITGCKVLAVLEAAHIKPYRNENDNAAENGLLLRADIHTLFDLFLLSIDPVELRVKVNPAIAVEYGYLDGKMLDCKPEERPARAALEWRYERFNNRCQWQA